jgi:hypothetical protein
MENEEKDFLKDLMQEGDEFAENPDPFADDEPEKEPEEEVEPEEKALPFHKDPKVQRYVEKQIAKALEGHKPEEPTRKVDEDEDDFYVRLIGNDTPEKLSMIKEARARDARLLDQAEERSFARLTKSQQEAIEADNLEEETLDNALEEIEEGFNVDLTSNTPVARKTRIDFMKFVERIAPKDRNGNVTDYPDMQAAFETFQSTRQTQPSRAKDLASRSMNRSSEVSNKPQEKVTFDSFDNFLDTFRKK